jgi:uncharacterized membrane protein YeaQ/YmgE (transglycosylase-associated protein family)
MMSYIIVVLVGALIGWLASIVMRTDRSQGALANIVIGIVGSLLGKWIMGDLLNIGGAQAAGSLSLPGLFYGVLGAVVLIAILKFFHLLGSDSRQS